MAITLTENAARQVRTQLARRGAGVGLRIDFIKEGLKQMFTFDNPNVDNTCGCGESFSPKETSKA